MKLIRKAGVTSEIWQIFCRDSSSTTGGGLTGLTNASSGLTAYYHRDTDTTATAISLVTMTVGTFTSSGFKEIDATNMPGWYQFCPPNAALASGAKSCSIHLKGATNMAPLPIEVELVAVDVDDTVRFGLTALPNVLIGGANCLARSSDGSSITTISGIVSCNIINAAGTAWNSGAITAATIATDAIGASELATDAVMEIVNTVWANDPMLVRTGTAQTGTQNSIKLDSGASSVDGTYDPSLVVITGGTGAGQARMIHEYNGSSKFATVGRNWRTIPDNTSQFRILASHQPISTNEGLATGGGASTITLNANASSINNTYNGQLIQIRTGTGQDQCRIISSYDGTTKIATVPEPWVTVPTTSTGYQIWPVGRAMVTSTMAGALTSSSFGSGWLTADGLATDAAQEIATTLLDLADGIESGKTLRQMLRLIGAALAGKRSNSGTASETFDAVGSPGTARIVGNLNASGDGTPTVTP